MCLRTENKSMMRRVSFAEPTCTENKFPRKDSDINSEVSTWWRLFALAALAFPRLFFLNRGFTQWFHWGFVFYQVTGRKDFWLRVLVLTGGGVCAGWYLAVVYDAIVHGRPFHLLYNNMPQAMRALMLVNGDLASGGILWQNSSAVALIIATHVLDIIAHPVLTYVAWKMHTSRGGSFRKLLTWDAMAAAYALSRVYSFTHQIYNFGTTGFYYYGFDVYKIDNLDSYTAAYVGEAILYVCMAGWKLYRMWRNLRVKIRIGEHSRRRSSKLQKKLSSKSSFDDKPALIKSSSCFSTSSTVEGDSYKTQ